MRSPTGTVFGALGDPVLDPEAESVITLKKRLHGREERGRVRFVSLEAGRNHRFPQPVGNGVET